MIVAALAAALTGCSEAPPPVSETNRAAATADPARDSAGVVLFVGTSLTAGYGLSADQAYPAVLQRWIDSAGLPFRVSNAGISGETSAGGLRRIEWSLQTPVEVLVLELGANDGLRALDPARMRENLDSIVRLTRARYPDVDVVIAGMEAPPNLGPGYTDRFRVVFRDLAEEHDAELIPFLLEGVAGVDSLNQQDGIHPTARGQQRLAANVWRTLEPVLRRRLSARAETTRRR